MNLFTAGWFSRPVAPRVPVRRSTAVLAVAFVGLGALYVHSREDDGGGGGDDPDVVVIVPETEDAPATT